MKPPQSSRVFRLRDLLLLWLLIGGCFAWAEEAAPALANRVVVLANSSEPDSVRLAKYYAEKRLIPAENIISLPMSLAETIRWPEFISTIFEPLQHELVRRRWIDGIESTIKDDLGRTKRVMSGHKISYLVVCRGVPLRIEHDAEMYRPLPPMTDRSEFQTNAAAVDSELSLLAHASYPISGFIANPLFGKKNPTVFELGRVVKVSRLDGPGLTYAMALVDSALEAEREGLAGRAYVDIGGPYKGGDVWFEEVARLLDTREFDLSVDRDGSTFPVTARFDRPVLYFGWYSADLNGPFTLPEFRFPPGAIALHLHSYSARTLNAVHQGWTGPLVARGVTATVGNVWEPYLEFTHQPQLLLAALLKGANWGDAAYASLRGLSWHAVTIGDPLYRPFAKTFAQQWADRAELPDEAFSYVVLSELRRLQRDGNVAQAIDEAREIMRTRPSLPVALKMGELLEAQQQSKDAAEAAAWFVSRPNFKPAEVPLAHLAGQLLLRVGDSQRAVQLYEKLLTEPTLVHDFRAVLLKSAVEAAEKTNRADLADAWKAEIARSSAKQ